VKYSSSKKEKYKDIKICYNSSWQKIHLKSIESAYRNSPYYDFFEDYFIKFFNKKEKFLIDANIKSIEVIYDILDMKMKYDLTNDYKNKLENYTDYRKLVDSNPDEKKSKINYSQVFQEKNGFISGLSSLDIIFNKGLESLDYINS
jgi:tRNA uridine 5-carbamoylmethylation protein Kti12